MEELVLPRPTSATVSGPRLAYQERRLVVEYDYQRDDGVVEWCRVAFHGVATFEFRRDVCCTAEDIVSLTGVVRRQRSRWLAQTTRCLRTSLGPALSSEEEASYADWRIYFDDVGCVGVVAQSMEIG